MAHNFYYEVVPITEAALELDTIDSSHSPLVLVVDDEPLIVDTMAAVLRSSGLRVLKAYGGRQALEIALECRPNLMLTDVAMPGMDGIDLAIAVSAALPSCRVLLFSGQAHMLNLEKPRSLGYEFPLIAKPVHPLTMLENIYDILRVRRGRAATHRSVAGAMLPRQGFSPADANG